MTFFFGGGYVCDIKYYDGVSLGEYRGLYIRINDILICTRYFALRLYFVLRLCRQYLSVIYLFICLYNLKEKEKDVPHCN